MNLIRSAFLTLILICCLKSVINQQLNSSNARQISSTEQSIDVEQEMLSKNKKIESLKEDDELNAMKKKNSKCEDYNYNCELCLSQEGCVFCWYENECVRQHHLDNQDYDTNTDSNQNNANKNDENNDNQQTPRIRTEDDARIHFNNTMLIQPLGVVAKNTCSKRNSLSNISASSCLINELSMFWLLFSSIFLSIVLLFSLLFYFCVLKSKTTKIIIEADENKLILIDED